MAGTRIAYFVHDINDPAVARRITMLRAAGATVVLAGFHRDERVPAAVAGAPVTALGRTRDARMLQRAGAVAANLVRPGAIEGVARDADIVIGRNLEALALAVRARRWATPGARLVYECLDIHRLLLGRSLPARLVQAAEARLLRQADLLIVSSPAFLREHFVRRALSAPALLVENKLLSLDAAAPVPPPAPAGPPWTIGWFGNLRCRRTFDVLSEVTRVLDGRVRVLIAGRPSPAEFADFPGMVAATPHFSYARPYTAADLPQLYAQCHFAWTIDYFEEGLNSTWLLPNRLYEAGSFDTVPIALEGVETGRWLAARGAGLLLDAGRPVEQLADCLAALDGAGYLALRTAMAAIPREALTAGARDAADLLTAIRGG